MKIETTDIQVQTEGFSDIKNLTPDVERMIRESGFTEGYCHVFAVGSTASISTMEFEPALVKDIKEKLEEFASRNERSHHSETWGDDNGFSHIRATFMGPDITIPFRDGKSVLGTWQQVVIINHDNRSRTRNVVIQVVGE